MNFDDMFSNIFNNEQRFREHYYKCGPNTPLAKYWGLLSRLDNTHLKKQEDILLVLNQVISTVEPVGE